MYLGHPLHYSKRFIFKRTPLDIPLLIFLGSSILSLLGSIDPHVSWLGYYSRWNGGLLSLLAYASLYWAFVSNMNRKSTLSLVTLSLVTATIISIYGILEHFGHSASCLLVTGSFDVSLLGSRCSEQSLRHTGTAKLDGSLHRKP